VERINPLRIFCVRGAATQCDLSNCILVGDSVWGEGAFLVINHRADLRLHVEPVGLPEKARDNTPRSVANPSCCLTCHQGLTQSL